MDGTAPPQGLRLPADGVRRIAVFRALVLGDLLCAVPALRALRSAYPAARITLIGLPWAESLVQRLECVDDFMRFPGFPGLPESTAEVAAIPAFVAAAQARRFDLALQMHGSGGLSNPIVALLGARRQAGFWLPGGFCPDPELSVPWPEHGHEIERCLALTDALGIPRRGSELEFPLLPDDTYRLDALWTGQQRRRYVVVHPGSQLPSRRWPVERFAEVAVTLAGQGLQVVVTGTQGEAALADALCASVAPRCAAPVVNLAGRTDLWTLGALLRDAELLVANDTGVSHIATALGTRSVIVACGSDVRRWAPLERERHRVLWHDLPCRPCQHPTCPTAHECAAAIGPQAVLDAATELLQRKPATSPCPTIPSACAS